jgi:hypothetical protein
MIVSSNAFVFSTSLLVVVFRYGFFYLVFFLAWINYYYLLLVIFILFHFFGYYPFFFFRFNAFPEHFTLFIYVVTSNLLIILSFRLNLETESLFHKLKARGPIRHPLFRYSCQHSRLGYTGLSLVSDQTTL